MGSKCRANSETDFSLKSFVRKSKKNPQTGVTEASGKDMEIPIDVDIQDAP